MGVIYRAECDVCHRTAHFRGFAMHICDDCLDKMGLNDKEPRGLACEYCGECKWGKAQCRNCGAPLPPMLTNPATFEECMLALYGTVLPLASTAR